MPLLDEIPKTYDDAVQALARWHGEAQGFDLEIYAVSDPQQQQVRLIEVSDDFPRPGPVVAIPLGRSNRFPFKSAVALATTAEWDEIRAGTRPAPGGWDLSTADKVWPRD